MTIMLYISENEIRHEEYEKWGGLFVLAGQKELCFKPELDSNKCYVIESGQEFEYDCQLIQETYFKSGLRKLRSEFDENKNIHPAYGLVSFSRLNGSDRCLFGSSIKHNNPIQLKVCHAKKERSLEKDWYYDLNTIVELELSQSQFAELITSMNVGVGVPCTLRFTELDGKIPDIEFENKKIQHKQELQNHIDGISDQLNDLYDNLKELFSKQRLNKSEKEDVLRSIFKIKGDLTYNADYMMKSFAEQMDKTVSEAKGEIESFMQRRLFDSFKEFGDIGISENDRPVEIE